jgi:serine/threonine protein kinase
LVDMQGVLAPSDVAALGAAVAQALATAHQSEVLHRDVKPANVLLGKDGAIKVTDFGIAALVSGQSEDRDRIFGTPGFLAPEVLLDGAWGPAADLFALGVTLHYALTAELPYPGATPRDLLRATLQGPDARPAGRGSEAAELELLILRLVARDPRARPANAEAVADELARLCRIRGWTWQSRPVDAVHAVRRAPSGQWLMTSETRRQR